MSPDYGKATCLFCGNEFERSRAWQKFCNSKCRIKHYAAKHSQNETLKTIEARLANLETAVTKILKSLGGSK